MDELNRQTRQVLALSRAQVVQHSHLVAVVQEYANEISADKTGTTGDKDSV